MHTCVHVHVRIALGKPPTFVSRTCSMYECIISILPGRRIHTLTSLVHAEIT